MDGIDLVFLGVVLFLLAALLWMMWLYATTYRRLVHSDRDRDRLIRRLGQYHSLPLTNRIDTLPPLPTESPVSPAFRTRRPQPPPGYRSPKGG